jgi:hypothetical protein
MSFWANVFWANVFWANVFMDKRLLGKCLLGQMSFWANVFIGQLCLGKCPSGQTLVWANVSGQMSLGQRGMTRDSRTPKNLTPESGIGVEVYFFSRMGSGSVLPQITNLNPELVKIQTANHGGGVGRQPVLEFHRSLLQCDHALGGIVPIFTYLNRFYVEAKLQSDVGREIRTRFLASVTHPYHGRILGKKSCLFLDFFPLFKMILDTLHLYVKSKLAQIT